MPSSYKRLGDYIQEVNIRNRDLSNIPLLGVSIKKVLMPSIANIIGTDMSTYKLIQKNQFAYGPVTSRNGDKISIALLEEYDNAMVSQAYTVFEVIDESKLLPEYLMMWFRRPEFDRYARFMSHGSAREIFSWTEMCETLLPIPSIEKQQEIVKEYHIIQNRIALNNQLISKLEETAQAVYKQWFVDFDNNKTKIEELFIPKKGKNITRDEAINGIFPVVAGGIEPSCFHNNFNTTFPVVTISASGANAGYVNLYHTNIWAADCSYIDISICKEIYFVYVALKVNQSLLMSKQIGTGQPHIYPEHIVTIEIPNYSNERKIEFNKLITPLFNKINFKNKENQKLEELKELLLAKMTRVEN